MKVGLTSGCFDLFHHSHLLFLEACKSQCDKLIVGVDSNRLVREVKGQNRPVHDEIHRLNLINSLKMVDIAFILHELHDLDNMVHIFNVDEIYKCHKFVNTVVYGCPPAKLVIIPDIPGMVSTTEIIRCIKSDELPVKIRKEF